MKRVLLFPFSVLSVAGLCVAGAVLAVCVLPGVFLSRLLKEDEE